MWKSPESSERLGAVYCKRYEVSISMKVTILTDKTSWMQKYLPVLEKEISDAGHCVNIILSPGELQKGDVAFFSLYLSFGNAFISP